MAQKQHTKRFLELMQRTEMAEPPYMFFNDEEKEYLGKEDLVEFYKKFPGDACSYMYELS